MRRVPFSSNVHGVLHDFIFMRRGAPLDSNHRHRRPAELFSSDKCMAQNHLEIDDILTVAHLVYSSPVILKECNLHRLPTGPAQDLHGSCCHGCENVRKHRSLREPKRSRHRRGYYNSYKSVVPLKKNIQKMMENVGSWK